MCGRFNQTASGDEVAEAFDLDEAPELAPRYNIAPTQPIAVVGVQPKTGRRGLASLTWGLVPRASLGGERGFINARAETAWEKPSFREAFAAPALPDPRHRLLRVAEHGREEAPALAHPDGVGRAVRLRRPVGAPGRVGHDPDLRHPDDRAQRRRASRSTTACRSSSTPPTTPSGSTPR